MPRSFGNTKVYVLPFVAVGVSLIRLWSVLTVCVVLPSLSTLNPVTAPLVVAVNVPPTFTVAVDVAVITGRVAKPPLAVNR